LQEIDMRQAALKSSDSPSLPGSIPKDPLAAAREACRAIGVSADRIDMIRDHANTIYRISGPEIVLRVAEGSSNADVARRAVAFGQWLDLHDYPAVRLAGGITQPVYVQDYVVTAWEYLPQHSDPPSGQALGPLLKSLHYALPAYGFEAPDFFLFESLRSQLDECYIKREDHEFLAGRLACLQEEYSLLNHSLPIGLIHGDAHRGNLLWKRSTVVMCDFDNVCYGPREWDLVPTAVDMIRFDRPRVQYEEFVSSYGLDVMKTPCWNTLRDIREIQMVMGLARKSHSDPAKSREFRRRVTGMRNKTDLVWRAF
jgi:Ser/Thr protein kinase RdoA (MazF antagonist)